MNGNDQEGIMTNDRHRKLIEERLHYDGLRADTWREGEDGLEAVLSGKWEVTEEDEAHGLYEGDEGELSVIVVGAPEYHNERVQYQLTIEQHDSGIECRPFENVRPLP